MLVQRPKRRLRTVLDPRSNHDSRACGISINKGKNNGVEVEEVRGSLFLAWTEQVDCEDDWAVEEIKDSVTNQSRNKDIHASNPTTDQSFKSNKLRPNQEPVHVAEKRIFKENSKASISQVSNMVGINKHIKLGPGYLSEGTTQQSNLEPYDPMHSLRQSTIPYIPIVPEVSPNHPMLQNSPPPNPRDLKSRPPDPTCRRLSSQHLNNPLGLETALDEDRDTVVLETPPPGR